MNSGNERYTTRDEVINLLNQTREVIDTKLNGPGSTAKKKRPLGKILRRIAYALMITVLLGALGKVWLAKLNGQVPDLFGYQIYVVETGSMIPTLPIGCTIIVKELGQNDELKVGDIITYSHLTETVTHRITELVVSQDGVTRYQTQGDNPDNSADPWLVAREDVRGIVIQHFVMPWAGK